MIDSGACNMWCETFVEYDTEYYDDPLKSFYDVCRDTDSYVQDNADYYEYTDPNTGIYSTVKNYVIAGEITFPN